MLLHQLNKIEMKKIGITGSLASGKTTASKIISAKKGPLFNADYVVKKIYAKKSFQQLISKKFNLSNNSLSIKSIELASIKIERLILLPADWPICLQFLQVTL